MWDISFVNLLMMVAAIPANNKDTEDKEKGGEITLDELAAKCNT